MGENLEAGPQKRNGAGGNPRERAYLPAGSSGELDVPPAAKTREGKENPVKGDYVKWTLDRVFRAGTFCREWLRPLPSATGARAVALARQASSSSREKLFVFAYSDVKLTGGPLRSQQDRIHTSYMGLDEDRLLKVYRQRAGLPAPGEDMGGWYDADGFGPGQVLGQIISGLSRVYCSTGDAATQAKVKRLVEGFTATIDSDGYCFPCLKSSTAYPAYTLDKIMIGLEDAYNFAGVSSALEALQRCIKGATRYLPLRAYERFEAPKQAAIDESYTLPENLLYAYELAKDDGYRELAKRYLMDRTYFDPLSRGENVLPGLHAYSHVNALCSAARAYLVLGEPKYLEASPQRLGHDQEDAVVCLGGVGAERKIRGVQ